MDSGACGTGGGYPGSSYGSNYQPHAANGWNYGTRYLPPASKRRLEASSGPLPPAKRRSVASTLDFNYLISPERFDGLKKRSDFFGARYNGKDHGQYAVSVKNYAAMCKRPLSNSEQNQLVPLLQTYKPAPNWSWRSLTTITHSFTSAGVFTRQPVINQTVRDTQASLLTGLLDAVLHKCTTQAQDIIDAIGVANLLWAMAKLVNRGQPLTPEFKKVFTAIQPHVIALKDSFKPQEISNLLWAMARLVGNGQELTVELKETVAALLLCVIPLTASFNPQHVANLLWAMAKLVDNGHGLTRALQNALAALLPHAVALKAHFKPQEITSLLWSMAKLVDCGQALSTELKETTTSLLPQVHALEDQLTNPEHLQPCVGHGETGGQWP